MRGASSTSAESSASPTSATYPCVCMRVPLLTCVRSRVVLPVVKLALLQVDRQPQASGGGGQDTGFGLQDSHPENKTDAARPLCTDTTRTDGWRTRLRSNISNDVQGVGVGLGTEDLIEDRKGLG